MWWGDFAPDQRPTDDESLVYDGAPLERDVEILGFPRALLYVSTDATQTNWFARLSDVAPDGRFILVQPTEQSSQLHVVLNEQDGKIKLITDSADKPDQVPGFVGVHAGSRLIKKNTFRI